MKKKTIESLIKKEKKKEALDFIFYHVFSSGFGTLNKSEIDSIFFAAIIEYGDKNISDLELCKKLEITQRRVQSLREKISIKYLEPINRKIAITYFVDQLEFAKKDSIYIDIPLNNISVKNEIEGLLDENHILLHRQLNSKIFRVRVDDFLELVLLLQANSNAEDSLNRLKEKVVDSIKNSQGKIEGFNDTIEWKDEKEIYHKLNQKILKSGIDVGLAIIKATVPAGGIAVEIVEKLMANFGILQNV